MDALPHHSLGLLEDEDDGVHPRRFLKLPSGQLLAYGGDQGNVTCLVPGTAAKQPSFVIAQQSDDPVRSMAVSHDGKRIAIGNDTGSTQIFTYDDYVLKEGELHPYVKKAVERHTNKKNKDSTNDDLMMSQDLDFDVEDESFQGPAFSTPVRDLVFLPNAENGDYRLVVATEEGMCIANVTSFQKLCDSPHLLEREAKEQHDGGGIRGLSIDGSGDVLASLAMDGRLCLWDVKDMKLLSREDDICVTRKDVGEVHDGDPLDRACRPVFHNNNVVATPGKLAPFLRIVETNDGKTKLQEVDESSFENADENGHFESIVSILFYSENLLVTSGRDSRVVIWQGQAKDDSDSSTGPFLNMSWKTVEKFQLVAPATDFCLHEKQLFAACINGQCHTLDLSKFFSKSSGSKATEDDVATSSTSPKRILKKDGKKSTNDSDDDDDDDIDFGGSSEAKASKGVRFVDDEADEDDDKGDDEEEEKADNDATGSLPSRANDELLDVDDYAKPSGDHRIESSYFNSSRYVRKVEPQEAFSPSETNPTNEDELRRFLCWNHIGCATLLEGEDDVNTIDIHFTDAAFKRSISFSDDVGLVLGSIGEDGGIFASGLQDNANDDDGNDIDGLDDLNMSERTKEAVRRDRKKSGKGDADSEPKGSQVLFWKFDSIEAKRNSTWSLNLPDGEEALGVACGEGWSAVMTSRRFLRFFSPGGTQGEIVWLKGDPVAMVGRGRFLAVFYHESSPLDDGTQKLGFTLWDASVFRAVAQGSVSCLSKASELTWAGFSNELSLFAMDSDGMLSMLVAAGDYATPGGPLWEWVPVLDTIGLRRSKDDSHWPISLFNGKLVCIPLKGGKKYPDASRRPVTSAITLRMPLSRSGLKSHLDLEEASVRANIALSQKKVLNEIDDEEYGQSDEYVALLTDVDKVTLKLLYNKICDGQLDAALGLAQRLHMEDTFEVAIKMADRHRQNKLASLIEDEKLRRYPVVEEDDGGYDDYEGGATTTHLMDRFENASSSQISPESAQMQHKKRSMMRQERGAEAVTKKHRFE